ncbi:MAG: helix-turn-helix transcriptional regulator [Victivallales bacterium]
MVYYITDKMRDLLRKSIGDFGTQAALARALEIPQDALSRYMSGKVSCCQKDNWDKIISFYPELSEVDQTDKLTEYIMEQVQALSPEQKGKLVTFIERLKEEGTPKSAT